MPDRLEKFCKENNILTFFYTSVKKNVNLEVVCHCLVDEVGARPAVTATKAIRLRMASFKVS